MSEDNGGSSEEELDLTVACRDCGGTGRADGGQLCMTCVGTGRIDPVLWRKPDETASFRDLAFSSWPAIVSGDKYFGLDISPNEDQFGPNLGHVIALLRRGEPVPKYGQRFLADLLEKLTTANKKPCKPPGRKEADDLRSAVATLEAIASIRSRLASSGGPVKWIAVYREHARQRNIQVDSARSGVSDAKETVRAKIAEYEQIFAQAAHPLGKEAEEKFLAPLKALLPEK